MRQRTAAEILGVSVRHVKRLLRSYRSEGAAGLVSKQRGKPSHHQLDTEMVQAALDLLKGRYADFGPTLAHEKLVEREGLKLCLGSTRKIMIEEGIRCGSGGHVEGNWSKWTGRIMTGSKGARSVVRCWS